MMENRLDRIEKQLDLINQRLMDYNTQLALHIEGVVQNRAHIAKLERDMSSIVVHVHEVKGVGKFFKLLAWTIGFCLSLGGLFKMIGII